MEKEWHGLGLFACVACFLLLVAAVDLRRSPVVPVGPERSDGELTPGAILGDASAVDPEFADPGAAGSVAAETGDSFWFDLDINGQHLFTAAGQALEIYYVGDPSDPRLRVRAAGAELAPVWRAGEGGPLDPFPIRSIDVPDGTAALAATAAGPQGLLIWDTSDKYSPSVLYQDGGVDGGREPSQVHARSLLVGTPLPESRHVAFVPDPEGVVFYDMTAASEGNGCQEDSRTATNCPGVFLGLLPTTRDAAAVHSTEDFLAVRLGERGVKIFARTDPATLEPASWVPRLEDSLATPFGQLALWREEEHGEVGGRLMLAVADAADVFLYDVSCVESEEEVEGEGSCRLSLVLARPVPDASGDPRAAGQRLLTLSYAMEGGASPEPIPFLYVGSALEEASCVPQREYLFDLTVPELPREVTPKIHRAGYWGWYYRRCFHGEGGPGFNNIRPRRGRFLGHDFYRAGFGVLDMHRWREAIAARFTWSPQVPEAGEEAQFIDLSSGEVTSWTWDFPGGNAFDASESSPVWIFEEEGQHEVQLRIGGPGGFSTVTRTVRVTAATGPFADFMQTPEFPEAGQVVQFRDVTRFSAPGGVSDAWFWTFEDGDPPQLSGSLPEIRNPRATFFSVGPKRVRLAVGTNMGSDQVEKVVEVVPPEPLIREIVPDPLVVDMCKPVKFTAVATGRFPLKYEWTDPAMPAGPTSTTATFIWQAAVLPGLYQTQLRVSNAFGEVTALSPEVEVRSAGPLQITTTDSAPVIEDVRGSRVIASLAAEGALDWRWDWGDGNGFGPWIPNDSSPTHYYAKDGTYTIRAEARNCVEGPITSVTVDVDIAPFEPLAILRFTGYCHVGLCFAEPGKPIAFDQAFTGDPHFYEYDWDGNGSFEQKSPDPVLSYAFPRFGNFKPRMRILRGSEPPVEAIDDAYTVFYVRPPPNVPPPPPPPED